LPDSITELKVNSLNGIGLKIELPNVSGYGIGRNMPFFINYIDERRISSSTTILLKAGVIITPGVFYEDSTYNYFEMFERNSYFEIPKNANKVTYCAFGFNFIIEPRWYWNFKNRAIKGKAELNSGWFLSLPMEISLPLRTMISTPTLYDHQSTKWLSDYFNLFYSCGISVGYRHAFSDKWFLESSIEMQAMGDWANYFGSNLYSTVGFMPQLEIKASYIFSKNKKQK